MRSIFFGVFQSLVVLLYILDNETNFVVQVSVFIGLLIDFWKITKVMDVKVSGGGAQEAWAGSLAASLFPNNLSPFSVFLFHFYLLILGYISTPLIPCRMPKLFAKCLSSLLLCLAFQKKGLIPSLE